MEFEDPQLLKAFLVFLEDLHWLVVALQEVVVSLLGIYRCVSVHGHLTPSSPSLAPAPPSQVAGVEGRTVRNSSGHGYCALTLPASV